MTPAVMAAEYLALTLPSDAEAVAELVGLPVATVAALRAGATASGVADLRRSLNLATRSLCVWTCRACGEVGPYSAGLDHWWAHWRAHEDRERRRERDRARRDAPPTSTQERSVAVARVCRLDDCGQPATALDLCNMHYLRWRRSNPAPQPAPMPALPAALCRTTPGVWVPDDEDSREAAQAVAVCRACPERVACAQYAITADVVGVWGGLRTRDREQIRQLTTQGGSAA